jgi:hypothetical protein
MLMGEGGNALEEAVNIYFSLIEVDLTKFPF